MSDLPGAPLALPSFGKLNPRANDIRRAAGLEASLSICAPNESRRSRRTAGVSAAQQRAFPHITAPICQGTNSRLPQPSSSDLVRSPTIVVHLAAIARRVVLRPADPLDQPFADRTVDGAARQQVLGPIDLRVSAGRAPRPAASP
jgi:hypothetical protein